jgi:MoaA/NifB/PqqE/SkfB family radical SAM enzyme
MDYLDKSGILFLQMTGGEALADPLFCETYSTAWNRGILISLSTNGSRLSNSTILKTLCDRPPQRITISVYGASEATYDALTLRPGSFRKFIRGLEAVKNAGLRVRLNIIVTTHNQHERHEMVKLAESFGFENHVFDEMTPTIYGGDEPMLFQATDVGVKDRTFTGCNAGKTFYHVDQTGHAMVCKVGRKPYIDLLGEGVGSLLRLNPISDQLLDESGMPQSHKGRICAPQSRQRTFEPKRAEIKLMLRVI